MEGKEALIQARKQDCRTQSEGRDLRAEGWWPHCLVGVFTGPCQPQAGSWVLWEWSCVTLTLLSSAASTQRMISEQSFMALGSA